MKQILVMSLLMLVSIFQTIAQDKKKIQLTIEISEMKSNEGAVFVALYKDKEDFLKKKYRGDIAKINARKAVTIFKNLEAGVYAVSVFHDENNNQKMDTNFFSIPEEPYGTSNNAKGFMGPPKYEDAKFTLTKNTTISINVH